MDVMLVLLIGVAGGALLMAVVSPLWTGAPSGALASGLMGIAGVLVGTWLIPAMNSRAECFRALKTLRNELVLNYYLSFASSPRGDVFPFRIEGIQECLSRGQVTADTELYVLLVHLHSFLERFAVPWNACCPWARQGPLSHESESFLEDGLAGLREQIRGCLETLQKRFNIKTASDELTALEQIGAEKLREMESSLAGVLEQGRTAVEQGK